MKRYTAAAALLFTLALACGGTSSGDLEDEFIYTTDVTDYAVPSSFSYTWGAARSLASGYAVIITPTINDVPYVGIAVSNNPDSSTQDLYIYFQSDGIPGSFELTPSNSMIIVDGSNRLSAGSLTLYFSENAYDGYTTYTITSTGSATVGGNTLQSLNIVATRY